MRLSLMAFMIGLMVMLTLPFFAQADTYKFTCATRDKSPFAIVEVSFKGSYQELDANVPVKASLKFAADSTATAMLLKGEMLRTAGMGPGFELSNKAGWQLTIAPLASTEPSTLVIKGKTIELACR